MQANTQYFNARVQLNQWSWGLYSLTLLPNNKFEYICQGYLDSEDNDWRGSYEKVDGIYTVEGNSYIFKGIKAISQSRSMYYQSGAKEYPPPTITGKLLDDKMTVKFDSGDEIIFERGIKKNASAVIVYSDRMFA